MLLIVNALKKVKILRVIVRVLYRLGFKIFFLRRPMLFIAQKILNLRIVMRDELISENKKYPVLRFGSEELVTVNEPYNLSDIPNEALGDIPEVMKKKSFVAAIFDKPFVCEVLNAQLVGPTAIAFDEDGNIIHETTMTQFKELEIERGIPARALIQKLLSKSTDIELDTACSLVFAWNKNYHHWLVDYLTRIEGLEYYQEQTGIKPTLIIESNLTPLQIESLKLLGYNPDNCVRWNRSKVKVKRLVIPSFRRNEMFVPRQSCLWLRQRMLSNLSAATSATLSLSPKIFISRRKALCRRVLNEDEVREALIPLGFVSYTLEEMSFSDQVRLFAQSEVIVAPHGAGLTNIIFSQNPIIIELFGSQIYNCIDFFLLSQILGYRYGFLRGESPPKDRRGQDSDMKVNIPELVSLIYKVLRVLR